MRDYTHGSYLVWYGLNVHVRIQHVYGCTLYVCLYVRQDTSKQDIRNTYCLVLELVLTHPVHPLSSYSVVMYDHVLCVLTWLLELK